jgi:hypothetical protein
LLYESYQIKSGKLFTSYIYSIPIIKDMNT